MKMKNKYVTVKYFQFNVMLCIILQINAQILEIQNKLFNQLQNIGFVSKMLSTQPIPKTNSLQQIPIIDLGPYIDGQQQTAHIAEGIRKTCKNTGFFYVKNHGVSEALQKSIIENSEKFFALPRQQKLKIHMSKGGKAWRGFFEVGEQLTSGKIDLKQGIYLGIQLDKNNEKCKNETPLHGPNLFPENPPQLKSDISAWLKQMDRLGGVLMSAIAQSLHLDKSYFKNTICKQHLGLLRIFHYPIDNNQRPELWAVGEHTDYGLLTILMISDKGLQVKNRNDQWVAVDPIPNTFVINIGDILEKMTRRLYKSTPHRAKNIQGRSRYSVPYFYDPGWDAEIRELDIKVSEDQLNIIKKTQAYERWDNVKLETISGSYGKYLTGKVSKVFPDLAKQNL